MDVLLFVGWKKRRNEHISISSTSKYLYKFWSHGLLTPCTGEPPHIAQCADRGSSIARDSYFLLATIVAIALAVCLFDVTVHIKAFAWSGGHMITTLSMNFPKFKQLWKIHRSLGHHSNTWSIGVYPLLRPEKTISQELFIWIALAWHDLRNYRG